MHRPGDGGVTVLGDEPVKKTHHRIRASACLYELAAGIALVMEEGRLDNKFQKKFLSVVRDVAFEMSQSLAKQREDNPVNNGVMAYVEEFIAERMAGVGSFENVIKPGGCGDACRLHMVRGIARRSESYVLEVAENEKADFGPFLAFLNRIGDAFFVLAREVNKKNKRFDDLTKHKV